MEFEAAASFQGSRVGKVFKVGRLGLGYYADPLAPPVGQPSDVGGGPGATESSLLEELRGRLPEQWRECSLRGVRLRVSPTVGAGITLGRSDFGFLVEAVDALPGQAVQAGDVIVAVEERVLAGMSAGQMQASFLKRRADGARLTVACLAEVSERSKTDPAVVKVWDSRHQRACYLNKSTGISTWSLEEASAPDPVAPFASGSAASASASGPFRPPIDLSSFLSGGWKPPQAAAKKRGREREGDRSADSGQGQGQGRAPKAKASASAAKREESELARTERRRWADWNAGGRGGYTEQFLERYKSCQSNPTKPKPDKRLKGSVGPGQGMEYMAPWTGSKNSFF